MRPVCAEVGAAAARVGGEQLREYRVTQQVWSHHYKVPTFHTEQKLFYENF